MQKENGFKTTRLHMNRHSSVGHLFDKAICIGPDYVQQVHCYVSTTHIRVRCLNGWEEKKVRLRRASHTDLHSEVLHRVLYPKAHGNGIKKKKRVGLNIPPPFGLMVRLRG